MSKIKEPHFYAPVDALESKALSLNRVAEQTQYERLFAPPESQLWGESSTTYCWRPETAARLAALSPQPRVIMVVRDPVERTFSHYLNDVRDGNETRPFPDALPDRRPGPESLTWGGVANRVELSFYADRIQWFRDHFGARLLVLVFEDLVADPQATLREIMGFLELAAASKPVADTAQNPHRMPRDALARTIVGSMQLRRLLRLVVPRRLRAIGYEGLMRAVPKPEMDTATRDRLIDLFSSDTTETEALLARALPWSTSRHMATS